MRLPPSARPARDAKPRRRTPRWLDALWLAPYVALVALNTAELRRDGFNWWSMSIVIMGCLLIGYTLAN